ncbi:TPA: DUF2057 family protein [Citrobacter freundii]
MKAGMMIMLIFLFVPVPVFATTLHLANEIDLLVLDGKKVSSSLLRGADSIELDNGPHQLVFRVEKTIRYSSHEGQLYISPPLVISFDTRLISQVNFHLPRLETEREAAHFDSDPRVELLDGDAMPVPVKLDTLTIVANEKIVNYEAETGRYNKAAKRASLPQFAPRMADDSSLLSGVSEPDAISPQSQELTGQRLKYWFKQADPQTRHEFMQWAEKQPSS